MNDAELSGVTSTNICKVKNGTKFCLVDCTENNSRATPHVRVSTAIFHLNNLLPGG